MIGATGDAVATAVVRQRSRAGSYGKSRDEEQVVPTPPSVIPRRASVLADRMPHQQDEPTEANRDNGEKNNGTPSVASACSGSDSSLLPERPALNPLGAAGRSVRILRN
jgi:hypothetical protein